MVEAVKAVVLGSESCIEDSAVKSFRSPPTDIALVSSSVTMWESARFASSPVAPACCRLYTFAASRDCSLSPSWPTECIWIPCEISTSSRAGALPLPLPSTSLAECVRTPPSWEAPWHRWLPTEEVGVTSFATECRLGERARSA